jgi:hypothetical protein
MNRGASAQFATGGALLALLMLPFARHALESGMRPHMLVQYPLLLLAGALLDRGVPLRWRQAFGPWNALGISGLTAVSVIAALLMIPRALDLALVDSRVEFLKFGALVLAGALLRGSWRNAGRAMQAFFLGGMLPMMIVAGTLYQEAPLRLCNAYRLDEQQRLGSELIWAAALIAVVWLWRAGGELIVGDGTRTGEPMAPD